MPPLKIMDFRAERGHALPIVTRGHTICITGAALRPVTSRAKISAPRFGGEPDLGAISSWRTLLRASRSGRSLSELESGPPDPIYHAADAWLTRRRPSCKMLVAAFKSRSWGAPQTGQVQLRTVSLLARRYLQPQTEQSWLDAKKRLTETNCRPYLSLLYLIWRLNSPQLEYLTAR